MAKNTDVHKYRDQEILNNIYDEDEKNIEVKISSTSPATLPTGAATSAKQDVQTTHLANLASAMQGTELQVDIQTMPGVTATDLDIRQLDSNDLVTVTGGVAQPDDVKVTMDSEIVGVNGELLEGIAGFTITGYDYIALTYVVAGNGAGEIETVTFKVGGSGGTTIATLTLVYDVNNEISSITKT